VQHTADLENVIQKLQVENTQLADKLNLKSTLEERNLVLKEQVRAPHDRCACIYG
jgi:cell shape-determining protein MreC